MNYYADTSWWLNFHLHDDTHHQAAVDLFIRDENAQVLWTPWQRLRARPCWLRACRLAAQHGPTLPIRGMDLFHVAIALTVRAPVFLSFDADQNALARAAGLDVP